MEAEPRMITYRDDCVPEAATIAALYRAAALNRPNEDLARIARMYETANMVLTAWSAGALVGILRAWNDGGFLAYIADLAVHPDYQRRRIARELLQRAVASDPTVKFLLHAAPDAMTFYPRLGWQAMDNAWGWPRGRTEMS